MKKRKKSFIVIKLGVRGTGSVLQLPGAYLNKTNKLKKEEQNGGIESDQIDWKGATRWSNEWDVGEEFRRWWTRDERADPG